MLSRVILIWTCCCNVGKPASIIVFLCHTWILHSITSHMMSCHSPPVTLLHSTCIMYSIASHMMLCHSPLDNASNPAARVWCWGAGVPHCGYPGDWCGWLEEPHRVQEWLVREDWGPETLVLYTKYVVGELYDVHPIANFTQAMSSSLVSGLCSCSAKQISGYVEPTYLSKNCSTSFHTAVLHILQLQVSDNSLTINRSCCMFQEPFWHHLPPTIMGVSKATLWFVFVNVWSNLTWVSLFSITFKHLS